MFKDKGLIIGILVTTVLIIGGVFYFTKDGSSSQSSSTPISKNILVPDNQYITSGYANEKYLPASESAKVTLVEFGDYECPACGVYHPFIKQLLTEFSGKVNFVFRNFPLTQHSNAQISSQAVEAAALQNKYWEMHDKVYETQASWSSSTNAKDIFIGYATELGMDVNKYKTDMDSDTVKNKIKGDVTDGGLVNLNATPTYYVNGVKIETIPNNYSSFKSIIEAELAK